MSVLEKDVDEQKAVENARRVEEERLTQQEKLYQVSCQTVCLSVCLSIRRTVTYSCLLQIPMTVAGGGLGLYLHCLSVCLFFHVPQTLMQLGSSTLTLKCSTMSTGNPFIWDQKVRGQGHESQNIAGLGLCTLVSAGFFWYFMDVY